MITADSKPYSFIQIAVKYIRYYLSSSTKHDIHSPLVFDFVCNVLNPAKRMSLPRIEKQRRELLNSTQQIDFTDYGKQGKKVKKKVAHIAKYSLKPTKYAKILAQVTKHTKAKNILELGTSLGITSAYIASQPHSTLVTMEGDQNVAAIAQKIWQTLGLSNIDIVIGNFDDTLSTIGNASFDIIYIDGNHHKEPTLRYFELLQHNTNTDTLFIFDDIHYSPAMEQAWQAIKDSDVCYISIDMFFLGFVFIKPTLQKQHFVLRY